MFRAMLKTQMTAKKQEEYQLAPADQTTEGSVTDEDKKPRAP